MLAACECRLASSMHRPAAPGGGTLCTQLAGEVYRRNGAYLIENPLLSRLPELGLLPEFGFVEAALSPLALQAVQVSCVC